MEKCGSSPFTENPPPELTTDTNRTAGVRTTGTLIRHLRTLRIIQTGYLNYYTLIHIYWCRPGDNFNSKLNSNFSWFSSEHWVRILQIARTFIRVNGVDSWVNVGGKQPASPSMYDDVSQNYSHDNSIPSHDNSHVTGGPECVSLRTCWLTQIRIPGTLLSWPDAWCDKFRRASSHPQPSLNMQPYWGPTFTQILFPQLNDFGPGTYQ